MQARVGTVKVDCRHDAVAALFVDQRLDRLSVMRDRLIGPVDVGLLENAFDFLLIFVDTDW